MVRQQNYPLILALCLGSKALAQDSDWDWDKNPIRNPDLKSHQNFKPRSMGALGDSMTAGFLAHFQRQTSKLPWNQAWLLTQIAAFGLSQETRFLESPGLSWATGLDSKNIVKSHARRLLSLGLKSGRNVINESVTGDASQELLMSQIHNLNKASRSRFGTQYPDYVTLLIGANDACAETTEEMEDLGTFYARFYMVTEELLWNSPKTHVLVSHLPNIEKIRAIAKDASVFGFDTLGITTCQDLWETINLCPTFTTLSDPLERQKVSTRISQYNQVMSDVTKQLRGRYGDRLRLSKRAYEVEFTPDHLSLDCFHPNARGQNMLSEETWKDSWWSDLANSK